MTKTLPGIDGLRSRDALSEEDRAAMFALLAQSFEGVTREQFERDLAEKNWVVEIRREDQRGQPDAGGPPHGGASCRMSAALGNHAWLIASLPAWMRYKCGLKHPEEAQQNILRRLLRENTASEYGCAYNFKEIRRYEQFRESVPITDYDVLEPWIARIARGEPNILTRAPVTRLLPTSGSTGGRKLIPFTVDLQREFNRAIAPWIVGLFRAHPKLIFGSSYWSISPKIPAATDQPTAVPVGFDDDSAYLDGVNRWLVAATLAAPSALRLVDELEDFRYLTLLSLLRRTDWSLASVWHPSFLTILFDALPSHWDELLTDIARGGCRRAAAMPFEVRRALDAKPQPERARRLTRIGALDPHAIWPRLRLVSCWGDGQAAFALSDLKKRLPLAVIQPKGLLATEAFVSIPFQMRHPLAITSHFFEFEDERGVIRRSHELLRGQSYKVIVTTGGGLWRYRLGDWIEVDGFVENTPSVRFMGRGGGVSDLCGEKLAEAFVTQALHVACESFGFAPAFAMFAPETDAGGRPRYVLFVDGDVPTHLADRLDDQLRRNPHYALCRDLGQLGPIDCFRLPTGSAYGIFCRVLMAEGRQLGDIKPQSLSSKTDWRRQFTEKR